jgi:phage antirepressor YoqD-like protein
MNELTQEKTMTIKELSKVLNVSERVIQISVKELFPEIVHNGKMTYLNEYQVTKIKMKLETHHNLEGTFEVKTNLQKQLLIKQAMLLQDEIIQDLEKENEVLKKKIIEDTPKVDFFDTVSDSKTAIEMSQVAKVIDMGYGRNELFEYLRQNKVLMSNNMPYQKYIDLEYFRVIEQKYNKPDGSICVNTKTLVYQKGIDYIIRLIKGV